MKEFWNGLDNLGKVKFCAYVLLGIFTVLFAVFNWKATYVNFVVFSMNLPLTIVILLSMVGGYALSMLMKYKSVQTNEKKVMELKKEVDTLRGTV